MTDSQRNPAPAWRQSSQRFFTALFDFSFTKFITVQMFPVLYGVILGATLIAVAYLTVEAFFSSWWRGLFYLCVAGPIGFITVATITRALIEFYLVVFRMAENVEEVRLLSERVGGLTESVESMRELTRRLPFWRAPAKSSEESDKPDKSRRKKDQNWPY